MGKKILSICMCLFTFLDLKADTPKNISTCDENSVMLDVYMPNETGKQMFRKIFDVTYPEMNIETGSFEIDKDSYGNLNVSYFKHKVLNILTGYLSKDFNGCVLYQSKVFVFKNLPKETIEKLFYKTENSMLFFKPDLISVYRPEFIWRFGSENLFDKVKVSLSPHSYTFDAIYAD